MNKYLKYIVFSMIMFLTLCFSVSALDCYYIKEYEDVDGDKQKETLEAHFRINEKKNTIVFSGVVGYFGDSSDNKNVKGENQGVENWNKNFTPLGQNITINFNGANHYSENGKCPPYAILFDRTGQFDLVVSDDDYLPKFKKYGADKQGTAVMDLIEDISDTLIRYPSSCLGLNYNSCKLNENFACVWVENEVAPNDGYCNVDNLLFVGCGGASDIPVQVPALISFLVNLLKIATPIILIFISIITLLKALASQKDDEIKKAQSSLVKKIIAAALVFFVVAIVQFVISKVASDKVYTGFSDCLDCFLNNSCEETTYYKTVVSGTDMCTPLTTGKTETCKELFKTFK